MQREAWGYDNGTVDEPGWSVESTIFFACHSSGVIALICPVLYSETNLLAFSSPDEDTRRVLAGSRTGQLSVNLTNECGNLELPQRLGRSTYHTILGEVVFQIGLDKLTNLGSDMAADCRTLPQYVERSYWEAGGSLLPGREVDILDSVRFLRCSSQCRKHRIITRRKYQPSFPRYRVVLIATLGWGSKKLCWRSQLEWGERETDFESHTVLQLMTNIWE